MRKMYVETIKMLSYIALKRMIELENVKRKNMKCKWSMVFNNTCIKINCCLIIQIFVFVILTFIYLMIISSNI